MSELNNADIHFSCEKMVQIEELMEKVKKAHWNAMRSFFLSFSSTTSGDYCLFSARA